MTRKGPFVKNQAPASYETRRAPFLWVAGPSVHGFDLDEIRIAGGAVCDASGHDDVVSGLEREHLLRRPQRVIKQDVGGIELLA